LQLRLLMATTQVFVAPALLEINPDCSADWRPARVP
jgi:hypothetical protein